MIDESGGIYARTLDYLLAPVRELLHDHSVSEVMINGFDEVYVERAGRLERTELAFEDAEALEAAARNIAQFVGKRLDPLDPSVEARLPDGSRVHILQAPAARKGLCIAIRKFSKKTLTLDHLVQGGSMSAEAAEFLGICVALGKNLMVSGGTGSGKTTLLNCLSGMIPSEERILVLEDASELQLQQEHVVPFEAQAADHHGRGGIDIRGLFRASLRMRPDRIIVGECRGGEALDMIQAMTSGHDGSMSTCHANTPTDALNRIETMCLMGDVDMPLRALRAQVGSALDLIVQISRLRSGARCITHITEIIGLSDHQEYRLRDLFVRRYDTSNGTGKGAVDDPRGSSGELLWTGERPGFANEVWEKQESDRIELTQKLWEKQ